MNAPLRKSRPYIFWGQTQSLCETCLKLVPAKIQIQDNEVWYEKRCRQHGVQSTLLSTDAAYWRLCKDYIKPGDKPLALQNRTEYGCPYDCGLCPDHEQHSCLALVEINEHCNLTCPVCFADSSPARSKHLPGATVERMLDALVASAANGHYTQHPAWLAVEPPGPGARWPPKPGPSRRTSRAVPSPARSWRRFRKSPPRGRATSNSPRRNRSRLSGRKIPAASSGRSSIWGPPCRRSGYR